MPLRFRPPFVRAVARHPSHPFALASALPQRGRARLRIFPEKGAASAPCPVAQSPASASCLLCSGASLPPLSAAGTAGPRCCEKGHARRPDRRRPARQTAVAFVIPALAAAYLFFRFRRSFPGEGCGNLSCANIRTRLARLPLPRSEERPSEKRMLRAARSTAHAPGTRLLPHALPHAPPSFRRRAHKALPAKTPGRVRHQQHSPLSGSMTVFSCAAQARLSQEGAPLALFAPTVPARGSHDNHGRLPQPG